MLLVGLRVSGRPQTSPALRTRRRPCLHSHGRKGLCSVGDPSTVSLDKCQCERYVLVDICVQSHVGPNWQSAKFTKKVLIKPFHPFCCVPGGVQEFQDLVKPVLPSSSPSPRLQMAVKSHLDRVRPCHQGYLVSMPHHSLYPPPSHRDPLPAVSCHDYYPWHCQSPAGGSSGEGGD